MSAQIAVRETLHGGIDLGYFPLRLAIVNIRQVPASSGYLLNKIAFIGHGVAPRSPANRQNFHYTCVMLTWPGTLGSSQWHLMFTVLHLIEGKS